MLFSRLGRASSDCLTKPNSLHPRLQQQERLTIDVKASEGVAATERRNSAVVAPIIKRSDPSARVTLTVFSHARPRFAPPPRELRIEGYTESSCSTHFQALAKHLSVTTSSQTTAHSTHLQHTAELLLLPLYIHTHTPPTTWLTPSFSPTSTASLPGKFFPIVALL